MPVTRVPVFVASFRNAYYSSRAPGVSIIKIKPVVCKKVARNQRSSTFGFTCNANQSTITFRSKIAGGFLAVITAHIATESHARLIIIHDGKPSFR